MTSKPTLPLKLMQPNSEAVGPMKPLQGPTPIAGVTIVSMKEKTGGGQEITAWPRGCPRPLQTISLPQDKKRAGALRN
jgi:hypothetical protein